jgi:hypothetical protein
MQLGAVVSNLGVVRLGLWEVVSMLGVVLALQIEGFQGESRIYLRWVVLFFCGASRLEEGGRRLGVLSDSAVQTVEYCAAQKGWRRLISSSVRSCSA